MSEPKIPSTTKGITSEWLTSVLLKGGIISHSINVISFEIETLEGGFNSTVARVRVKYNTDTAGPSSFVIKFASVRGNDNANDKELYFYQNIERIGLPVPFRAPRVYFSSKSGRTYIYLLEDLHFAKHISQAEGADYEVAKRVTFALASFHAKFWNSSPDSLSSLSSSFCPLADKEQYYQGIQEYMKFALDDFNTLVTDEEVQKTAKFCAENLSKLVKEAQKSPTTLLHGDARLSNFFFEGESGVIAVDWQGFNVGSGPGELAYFLSMNVQEEVRKKHENEFIHLYHDTLIKSGAITAESFPFDACYHKYIIGVATSAAVPILTARGVIEGANKKGKPIPNLALAETFKAQIAMHDTMIDSWSSTAHNHPITSIKLD